ncbi:MAG: hypothetical protein EVB11_10735 [Winogradskyella sp.]|nr:MAG: hypothetical protein EVB11_10735 [Winogradskyella sp.]
MFKRIRANINISKINPLSKAEIDTILIDKIDSSFTKIGLNKKLGNRIWFSDFDSEGTKNVIRFQLSKGLGAVFIFGKCFSFLPTISNNSRFINHKTDKSTELHLFDYSSHIYSNSLISKKSLEISIINQNEFKNGISNMFKFGVEYIDEWFNNNNTISNCLSTAENQLKTNDEYSTHFPDQNYVLSFLYNQLGDKENTELYLNKFLNHRACSDELEFKIRSKLNLKLL